MFNLGLMFLVLMMFIVPAILLYVLFPRQTKNTITKIIPSKNRRYVVCHMRYESGMEAVFHVIPNPEGLTKVENYSYNLKDTYIALRVNRRAHYVLDENNAVPRTFEKQTNETLIYQAAEIQTALDNSVMDYLFSKKKDILLMGLFILAIICSLFIAYTAYELRSIQDYITASKAVAEVVIK